MAFTLDTTDRCILALCLGLKGCIGPLTFRSGGTGRDIVYYERKKLGALSAKQLEHRAKFNRSYEQWRSMTADQRADWDKAARVTSSRQIGAHLFVLIWWRQDEWSLYQIFIHHHIDLFLPGP